jgi:hypothetical protein
VIRYGRLVEHDEASKLYPASTSTLVDVLHEHVGPVLDQGQVGSCTGNAAAQALNTRPLYVTGRRLLNEADAVGIYSWATHHDGFPGIFPPTDTGSSGLAVAKALHKSLGLISGYRHAFGLAHALGALVTAPVIIGTPWTDVMEEPDDDGTIHFAGSIRGGHETCLVGIDVEGQRVRGLNSWSSSWGDEGFYWLSWDDLGELLHDHGDATILVR